MGDQTEREPVLLPKSAAARRSDPEKILWQRLARRNDFRTWRLEPTTRGRARNTLSNGVINLARRSDEIPKSMVLSTLNRSRGSHDSMIVISARESNRKDEISRKKVQNVVTVSTVDSQEYHIPGVRRRQKRLP